MGLDVAAALDRARGARVARLATTSPSLGVDVVPITFALTDPARPGDLARLATAVDHKPKSTTRLRRLANIRAHPEVTVLVDHYEDDWDRLWWVRLRGTATIHTEGSEFDAGVAALVERYPQYREVPPAGPAILVDVHEATGWEGSG